MKKLAIIALVVASVGLGGCHRAVATAPAGGVGGATPREAIQRFMASASAQDLQAMSFVWGTSDGPAQRTIDKDVRDQREIIMMCFLKHDSYRILSESPGTNGERVFNVELTFKNLTKSSNFFATRGPADRWFIREFAPEPLRELCAAKK